jgi:transposase
MARYTQDLKSKVVARLLPPEAASLEAVSNEVGVSVATLERWRSQALAEPAQQRSWTAAARLDAILTTAALDEQSKSAWCRSHGLFPQELAQWQQAATQALEHPGAGPAPSGLNRDERARIKELERELRRKERALAETAALLVLSKKLEAIFPKGEAE